MNIRYYFPLFKDEGEIIALFGQARLVKFLNGKYELRGGSKEDRLAAHEWISMFCHDVVVRER
jgi:hypothetical protein